MTQKRKSIGALLRGYLFFQVYVGNKRRVFNLYHEARDYRLTAKNGKSVVFDGWNVWKYISDIVTRQNKGSEGVRGFYRFYQIT